MADSLELCNGDLSRSFIDVDLLFCHHATVRHRDASYFNMKYIFRRPLKLPPLLPFGPISLPRPLATPSSVHRGPSRLLRLAA